MGVKWSVINQRLIGGIYLLRNGRLRRSKQICQIKLRVYWNLMENIQNLMENIQNLMENIQNLVVHDKIVRCKVESVRFNLNTLKFVKAEWDLVWPYGTMTAKHIASIYKKHNFCFHYQLTITTCRTVLCCILLLYYKSLCSITFWT